VEKFHKKTTCHQEDQEEGYHIDSNILINKTEDFEGVRMKILAQLGKDKDKVNPDLLKYFIFKEFLDEG
tara:strand:+ start:330 stop:536 length:207 start_codon:yes stop_codon:yes gene_type:complete